MTTENYEQFFKTSNQFLNPMNDLNKIATEMFRRIAQQNLELMGENISLFSEQLKRLSNVKKPEDLLAFQKECFTEDVTTAIEHMQKIGQTSLENMEKCAKACASIRETVNPIKSAEKNAGKSEKVEK